MKISFDFDCTITEPHIKELAKVLISANQDVWIVTARNQGKEFNRDLYKICDEIGLPHNKVIYTEGNLKVNYYFEHNFDLHYDDEWDEVLHINNKGGSAILVEPDFEEIYMNMQFEKNQNKNDI